MSVTVSWDGPSAEEPDRGNQVSVDSAGDLDAVLDRVAAQAAADDLPYAVQIHNPDAEGSVMIGFGHPRRSFVTWLLRTPRGHAHDGYEPDVPEVPEPIAFDRYGQWCEYEPAQTRVHAATARQAAHQYLITSQRPTCIQWIEAS